MGTAMGCGTKVGRTIGWKRLLSVTNATSRGVSLRGLMFYILYNRLKLEYTDTLIVSQVLTMLKLTRAKSTYSGTLRASG